MIACRARGRVVSVSDCLVAFPLKPSEAESFAIGELSEEFGVSVRALRFYEEEGLLTPRREGPTRIYSRRDRARLAWIMRGKSVGFSLDDIRELIDLYDLGDNRATQRAATAERCRARAAMLRRQLEELQATIAQLTTFARSLEKRD